MVEGERECNLHISAHLLLTCGVGLCSYTQSRGSRREVLLTFPTLVLGGLVVAPAPALARTTNLEEARRRGEEAR